MKKNALFILCFIAYTITIAQNSLQFNGAQFVKVNNPDLTAFLDNQFSIEATVKQTAPTLGRQVLLKYYNNNINQGFMLFVKPNGELVFKYNNQNYVFPDFTLDKKCHAISVVKRNFKLNYYVDGALLGTDFILDINPVLPKSTKLFIGGKLNGTQNFIGEIDEVRFHKNARNKKWINNHIFNSLTGNDLNGFVAYYSFDTINNQTVLDDSNNTNNGVLGNSNTININDPSVVGQSCITPIATTSSYCSDITYNQQPYVEHEATQVLGIEEPEEHLGHIFDSYGNRYAFENIKITKDDNNANKAVFPTCTSGYFTLHFEPGSGMESTTDPIHANRRAVLCQVFNDISNMISSPLTSTGNTVNIWMRDLNQMGGTTNVLGKASAFTNLPTPVSILEGSLFPSIINGGIADNEVWKTIHTGISSYTNVGGQILSDPASSLLYHGMMGINFDPTINWNTNSTAPIIPGTQFDLYTVALHEVAHLLGFSSFISPNGTSAFGASYNYYSRYDTFLQDANGANLITNTGACSSMYDYTFTGTPSVLEPSCSTTNPPNQSFNCTTNVQYNGTPTVQVYNPGCYEAGSSLSHFEDQCFMNTATGMPYGNDAYFVMSNSTASGTIKRNLTPEEQQTLCDLGYSVNNSACSGIQVAGVNDGQNLAGTGFANIPLTFSGILTNDTNATGFECLEDVYDPTATLNITSGNNTSNITFTSGNSGLHLLRYVPTNGNQKGNITYVFIYLLNDPAPNNCGSPTACDLIINGDFEQNSAIPENVSQLSLACNWGSPNLASPDYFHRQSTGTFTGYTTPRVGIPDNLIGFPNINTQTVNNGIGDAYIGMFCNYTNSSSLYSESIKTRLAAPLTPNTNYTLTFDAALLDHTWQGYIQGGLQFQAFISSLDILTATYGGLPITSGTDPDPSGILLNDSQPIININNWTTVTFTFNSGLGGQQFLYLGGLLNPVLSSGVTTATGGYTYVDNVSLVPINEGVFDIPDTISCLNNTIANLTTYVSNIPSTGVFTGTGVTDTIFDPVAAGIGSHLITYTYTSSIGCEIVLTDTITVTEVCQRPYISQIYENSNKDYIEVKNPDLNNSVAAGIYYLALYENGADTTLAPTSFINIGTLSPEQAVYFRSTGATDTAPNNYATNANGVLPSGFDTFDANNDLLILTTTTDANAYLNRIDLAGDANDWGSSQTLLRSSCAQQYPRTDAYEVCDWASVTLAEVAGAYNQNSNTNVVLGRHFSDILTYTPTGWTDLSSLGTSNPDHSRETIIQFPYDTNIQGSFQACSITVEPAVILTINPSTFVRVQKNVVVQTAGTLDVENQGSLVMVHDACYGVAGPDLVQVGDGDNITVATQTVGINAATDYVFWSSPLTNNTTNLPANSIANLFATANGFPSSRFFGFRNINFYDQFAGGYTQSTGVADSFDDNGDDYYVLNATERAQLMAPGLGYATWPNGATNYTINFSGQTNNGIVTVPVYRNDSADGLNVNLIGNPYPSPILLDRLFEVNDGLIDPVAYVWGRALDDTPDPGDGPLPINYTTDNFLVYNPNIMVLSPFFANSLPFNSNGLVASCQSFFVTTTTDQTLLLEDNTGQADNQLAGNLVFNNSMRSILPNNTFAKQSNPDTKRTTSGDTKIWLNLTNTQQTQGAQIGVAFLENGSPSYTAKEDVKVPYGRNINFYTTSTDADLIIDCQDAFSTAKTILLGFTSLVDTPESLRISIAKTEGMNNQTIFVEDILLGIVHNLTEGDYTFTTNQGVYDARFKIVFSNNSRQITNTTDGLLQENDIRVYTQNNTLIITSADKNIVQVVVNDIYNTRFGTQLIDKKQINKKEVTLPIGEQHKLIQVTIILEDGTKQTKKILL